MKKIEKKNLFILYIIYISSRFFCFNWKEKLYPALFELLLHIMQVL